MKDSLNLSILFSESWWGHVIKCEWGETCGCGAERDPCLFLSGHSDGFISKSSLIPVQWSKGGGVMTQWMCKLSVNGTTLRGRSFPGISELCRWPWRMRVSLHESLMVWRLSLRALCKTALTLFLQVCVSSIASSLSHSLFLSSLHLCFSHSTERRLLGKRSPPMLCGLSSDTAFLRVRCLPSALLPLADRTDGKAGSQSDWALWMVSTPTTLCLWCLSERWPLWPACVCFFRRRRLDVKGGVQRQEAQVMGGGGFEFGMEGGRSEMEIQRSVFIFTIANQLDCRLHAATVRTINPPPHFTKRRDVQHTLRCIVGPIVFETQWWWWEGQWTAWTAILVEQLHTSRSFVNQKEKF